MMSHDHISHTQCLINWLFNWYGDLRLFLSKKGIKLSLAQSLGEKKQSAGLLKAAGEDSHHKTNHWTIIDCIHEFKTNKRSLTKLHSFNIPPFSSISWQLLSTVWGGQRHVTWFLCLLRPVWVGLEQSFVPLGRTDDPSIVTTVTII